VHCKKDICIIKARDALRPKSAADPSPGSKPWIEVTEDTPGERSLARAATAELEVLCLIAEGWSDGQSNARPYASRGTIHAHHWYLTEYPSFC
jgi:hypothetical protein